MTSTRGIVCFGRVGGSDRVSLFDKLEDVIIIVHKLLLQTSNLNLVVLVFLQFQDLMIVQQIVHFASVDFIHRNCNSEVSLVVLPVVNSSLK